MNNGIGKRGIDKIPCSNQQLNTDVVVFFKRRGSEFAFWRGVLMNLSDYSEKELPDRTEKGVKQYIQEKYNQQQQKADE